MNLERTKPEQLAAGVMDYMPQSLAAHDYAERLNAALARLGLTERLTLPPAPNTAIDELPAVVDVPLRKTLSVLMGKAQQGDASALATLEWTAQVAESIFAGLHARDFAGDRPLALPSHESLATLSQGVDALLPRKISNGAWSLLADGTPSDGIQDGMSLVRLFCTYAIDSVTELKDDNEGWDYADGKCNTMLTTFPNVTNLVMGCKTIKGNGKMISGKSNLQQVEFPLLESYGKPTADSTNGIIYNCPNVVKLLMPKLSSVYHYSRNEGSADYAMIGNMQGLQEVVFGNIVQWAGAWTGAENFIIGCPNLIHLEFAGVQVSLNLKYYNPTSVLSDSERLPIFLSNFKTYIAERLSEQGSGLTLTLSQAVRDAIQTDPEIVSIITSKGWTISPAPSV